MAHDVESFIAEMLPSWECIEGEPELYEVVVGGYHDGWNGAAGAEIREEPYEPYPHSWDCSAMWCRIKFAVRETGSLPVGSLDRDLATIPGWVFYRALPCLVRHVQEIG